jgi:hypothetical protein
MAMSACSEQRFWALVMARSLCGGLRSLTARFALAFCCCCPSDLEQSTVTSGTNRRQQASMERRRCGH